MIITKDNRVQGAPFPWLLVSLFALLFPTESFAWAPATHLYFAKEVFQFSSLLPVAVRSLLAHYSLDYLYGCIAADITLGKAFVEYMYNCHNFDVGFGLLKHTCSDSQKAFVYGYLSHLAADTVSHNFFVPFQNIQHLSSPKFRHAYWEVRLDQYFTQSSWRDIENIMRNPANHDHDRLLDGALKDTIFSFKTNKVLFSSMMAIQRFRKWQQLVRSVNRRSRMQFNPHELSEYNRLAVSAVILLLSQEKNSPVYRVDPTGCKSIEEATGIRKSLKALRRTGRLTRRIHEEECHRYREAQRKRFFSDYVIDSKSFHPSISLAV